MDPNYNYLEGLPNSNMKPMPYINKAIGEVKNYYDPFTNNSNAPEDFINRLSEGFNQSPSQKKSIQERLNTERNIAASQGRYLNPEHMENSGNIASSMYDDQLQRYIDNVFKERGINFQAAQGAAGDVGNLYNQAGGLTFRKDMQTQQNQSEMWQTIMKSLAQVLGAMFSKGGGIM